MGKFLAEPHVEKIASVLLTPEGMKTKSELTVGVQLITEDNAGLKIVPIKMVVIEIDEKSFNLFANNAREIAESLWLMADSIDEGVGFDWRALQELRKASP